MDSYFNHVVCLECGHSMTANMHNENCEQCGSQWLDARYDYEAVAKIWEHPFINRPRSLWRYGELLPIQEPDPEISLSEGYTPLIRLYQYERMFNHEGIYIKDERHQPTNSFKDRQASLSVTAMKRAGVTETVLASTGNAGVAYAAFCARAGIKLWLFLTSLVPAEKMREVALYGAEVVKVSGTYDETKKVAAEFAHRKGITIDKGAKTIPAKESMKTLGYEIAEQFAKSTAHPHPWKAPDWYIQAVSGGIGPLGVMKGFEELLQMGLIDKVPKLALVQAAGCAPMVEAFHAGAEVATPVIPKTLIHVLATGDPGPAYVQLRAMILKYGGTMLSVEDGATFNAMRHVASRAGISVEPATAVAFAGLEKMFEQGIIAPGESIVLNCSGHTLLAESHILGDQYDKYILDLKLEKPTSPHAPQEEGLGAALQNLDEQVTTIVIIDDNANDRRLIRRLLQSYKNYRVYEARDGAEGIQVVRERQPDLVVCDLTMPEMDGFNVLETLKNDPDTAHIPVVVISAKSLTAQDRSVLDKYSESVWTKGGFDTRQLIDHVVDTLGHTPVEVLRPLHAPQQKLSDQPEAAVNNEPVIIVIEDNPSDLRLARKMLNSVGGYHVIEAQNGRDGLKAIYNYHPDLIILDLMLPDVDGFSIIETLKKDVNLREIPIIVVSAKTLTAEEQTSLQSNMHTVIEKASLDRNKFLSIITKELG